MYKASRKFFPGLFKKIEPASVGKRQIQSGLPVLPAPALVLRPGGASWLEVPHGKIRHLPGAARWRAHLD